MIIKILASSVLLSLLPVRAMGQTGSVEIWMRAFIPDPANAGQASNWIRAKSGGTSGSLVTIPLVPDVLDQCFATDHRGFGDDAGRSARVETRFTLRVTGAAQGRIEPSNSRTTAQSTTRVDCATGASIETGDASASENFGAVSTAAGVIQVIGDGKGTNVLTYLDEYAASIDYGFDVQWQPATASLVTTLTLSPFPAFEMYARRPGHKWIPVIQHTPTGSPITLMGTSREQRMARVTIPSFTGKWHTTDAGQRFSFEFVSGERVRWAERNSSGAVLTREVAVQEQPDGSYRIDRPNDAEVLAHLGFQPAIRAEILARSPQASYILLSPQGDGWRANWYGLLVTKNSNATLKELVQPGTRPPTAFTIARTP